MIELLAVAEACASPEPPVRAVPSDGVSVLCADAPARELTAADLWRREELVERLMQAGPLLPVRFGTLVTDELAAAGCVAGRGDELRELLEHVRGAVELSVRVRRAPAASTGGSASSVHQALAGLARDTALRPGPDLLRAGYLVERAGVQAFVARVRELQLAHAELAILCTGPWPAYSFAEAA